MLINHFPKFRVSLMLFFCLALGVPSIGHADSPARQASSFASGSGNILYLAAAVGLPLLSDGKDGRNHSLRVLDSLGTSVLLTEGLKGLFREKRPDSNDHDSFPSGHATAAFAVATTESALHPKQSALWYLGATVISYSRVRLHRHYGRDVIAGALIGYGMARLEVSTPHGLLLAPLITSDKHAVGLQMSEGF
jgi:membrane-associated phospholipid phosphatase